MNTIRWRITTRLLWILLFGCLALATGAATAQKLPDGVTAGPVVDDIAEYRLANGLAVVLVPDSGKPTTTVNITYLVGSRHEGYGETGMAHLLEHLLFKGTPRNPGLDRELDRRGMRNNGTTWLDRTNYYETFAASDANLEWALRMEADRMINSFVARRDLDSEMTVVRNEMESGENDPLGALEERMLSSAFQWHNYGKVTIGARSDVENVDIDRLQAFYRRYYQPDNAVLVVAGRFDPERALAWIADAFGSIPRPERTLPRTYTREPVQDGERAVTVRRNGQVQWASALYHIVAGADPDFAAVEMLASVLGEPGTGRLHRALVEKRLAASVYTNAYGLREPGYLIAGAQLAPGASLDELTRTLLAVLEGVDGEPVTLQEVERARAKLRRDWLLTVSDPQRFAIGLSEWIAKGDWRLFFAHREQIEQAGPADLTRIARAFLRPSNRTLGQFIPTTAPERAPRVDDPDVPKRVAELGSGAGLGAGERFDATPENVLARAVTARLPTGARLVTVAKKNRGNLVSGRIQIQFGTDASLAGLSATGELTGALLDRGTRRRSRTEWSDAVDRLTATVSISGSATGASVSFETVAENVEPLLDLIVEALREPALLPAELAQIVAERVAATEESKTDPQSMAMTSFRRRWNAFDRHDVRYTPTPEERIEALKAVSPSAVAAFHKRFYGGGVAQIAVVGTHEPDRVRERLARLLSGWTSDERHTPVTEPFRSVEPQRGLVPIPDKASAFIVVGTSWPVRDDDPDYPALALINHALGGYINARLPTRLRQRDGLSYDVGTYFSASPLNANAAFGAYAIFAPENLARVEAGIREELADLRANGFPEAEFADAQSAWQETRRVALAQDSAAAGRLAESERLGRSLLVMSELDRRIAALTRAEVQRALVRYFDPARMVTVAAGSFPAAAAPGSAGAPPAAR